VTVKRLVRVRGNLRQNNRSRGGCQGTLRRSGNRDAALVTATSGKGRVVGHYDRNTFFNQNGAGTNINRFDNKKYALNLFNWLLGSNPEAAATEQPILETVKIYPNPVKDLTRVSGLTKGDIITIYNNYGIIVKKMVAQEREERIVTKSLPAGIYILSVSGKDQQRFLKK